MELVHDETNTLQQLSELRDKMHKLLSKRDELLETVNSGEVLKSKLRETRKGTKYLSKQKDKLRALADVERPDDRIEEFELSWESLNGPPEDPHTEENLTSIPPPPLPTNSFHAEEPSQLTPPPPPPPQQAEVMSGEHSPVDPTGYTFAAPGGEGEALEARTEVNALRLGEEMNGRRPHVDPAGYTFAALGREGEALEARTEANALRLEKENLVRMKRKLEEQVQSLVQEVAALEAKYEELRGIAKCLETENQQLLQCVPLQRCGQQTFPSEQTKDSSLMKLQLKVYEEDFKKERSERENAHAEKERLREELNEAKATIRTLQRQLKEALTGEGGYGSAQFSRHEPIINEPYNPYMPAKYPLNYQMARTYSAGCIGPSASQDVLRREHAYNQRRAFLSPDMTAVIDHDVVDGSKLRSLNSI